MEEYYTLLLKRGLDALTTTKVVANLEHFGGCGSLVKFVICVSILGSCAHPY
jgi:hypothetical protein